MHRFAQITALSLFFLVASFGSIANAMQGGGCGCGGSGVACQTNQRVVLSTLALVACFYEVNVVYPLTEGRSTGAKWLIHALAYGIPAGVGYAGYTLWTSEAQKPNAKTDAHAHTHDEG